MDTMKEFDPNGTPANSPGAKLDAGKPRPSLIFRDMARALDAVVDVATFGANKYSDGGWLVVPNAQERYTDAMLRHYTKEARGEMVDTDSGLTHQAHLAWNALARLELMLREQEQGKAFGAHFSSLRAREANSCAEVDIPYSALDRSVFERGSN